MGCGRFIAIPLECQLIYFSRKKTTTTHKDIRSVSEDWVPCINLVYWPYNQWSYNCSIYRLYHQYPCCRLPSSIPLAMKYISIKSEVSDNTIKETMFILWNQQRDWRAKIALHGKNLLRLATPQQQCNKVNLCWYWKIDYFIDEMRGCHELNKLI
jgi:hypothetical protein